MIYITGSTGQLGQEFIRIFTNFNIPFRAFSDLDWDFRDYAKAPQILSPKPKFLINTAAYTLVDKAESEKELAYSINHKSLEPIAIACKKYGIHLIHFSTDFVFSIDPIIENNELKFFTPEHIPNAKGIYAESKRKGEEVLLELLKDQLTLIRTSWLYSPFGFNFPRTILRLLKDPNHLELKVIEDQIGRPTYARSLAEFTHALISLKINEQSLDPIYHFSNSGIASWYDFAVTTQEIGLELGILKTKKKIIPISTKEYPTPAYRPKFSVMDLENTRKIFEIPHWKEDLLECLSLPETSKLWNLS
jgi:dTDP-4-dehydrorhamnose reductase